MCPQSFLNLLNLHPGHLIKIGQTSTQIILPIAMQSWPQSQLQTSTLSAKYPFIFLISVLWFSLYMPHHQVKLGQCPFGLSSLSTDIRNIKSLLNYHPGHLSNLVDHHVDLCIYRATDMSTKTSLVVTKTLKFVTAGWQDAHHFASSYPMGSTFHSSIGCEIEGSFSWFTIFSRMTIAYPPWTVQDNGNNLLLSSCFPMQP